MQQHGYRVVDFLRSADWVTRERILLWGSALALASVGLLVWLVVTHVTLGITDIEGNYLGGDFINYWAGARIAASGQAGLAYDPEVFFAFERSLAGPAAEFKLYGYPPVLMLLSWPLVHLSFVAGLIIWSAGGTALCTWLLSRETGWRMAALAMIAAPAAYLNISCGQNGHFTAALFAGGIMLLDRRPVLAGVLFGMLCYKPQVGFLLPVALVAGGRWRTITAAAVTVACLVGVSLALYGTETWAAFLDQMTLQRRMMELGEHTWLRRMPTVFSTVRLIGAGAAAAYTAQVISAILAAATVAAVWRARCAPDIKAVVLVVATFLVSPYAWDYDMVIVIFAVAWLARHGMRNGFLPWERITVIVLLALPIVMIMIASLLDLQIGPVALWLVLLLLMRRAFVNRTTLGSTAAVAFGEHTAARV